MVVSERTSHAHVLSIIQSYARFEVRSAKTFYWGEDFDGIIICITITWEIDCTHLSLARNFYSVFSVWFFNIAENGKKSNVALLSLFLQLLIYLVQSFLSSKSKLMSN